MYVASGIILLVLIDVGAFFTWLIASGISKNQPWARITFVILTLLSMPTRISSLFTRTACSTRRNFVCHSSSCSPGVLQTSF